MTRHTEPGKEMVLSPTTLVPVCLLLPFDTDLSGSQSPIKPRPLFFLRRTIQGPWRRQDTLIGVFKQDCRRIKEKGASGRAVTSDSRIQ
ncbi:hypothetical protein CGRA01v4_03816 [Colletotrichum graminicola]|nr:hypothetical protein CGRA01v4_03816 [Colletotrichum graminicola]